MNRRTFLSVLSGSLLAAPLAVEAQSPPTVRRIGVMGGGTPEYIEARKEGLRRLGWIEGQNIIVEQIPVGNKTSAQLQEVARDLVRLKVEVIVANNNERIAASKSGDHDDSDCNGPCG
jgi:hypothetical protein